MRPNEHKPAWSLVIFTVLAQAAAGVAAVTAFVPSRRQALSALLLFAIGGTAAAFHLGRIPRGRFALSNLGSSWLSREILAAGIFGATLVAAVALPGVGALRWIAALAGLALVAAISQVYRIRTVPTWDTWRTPASFFLTAIVLGTALASRDLAGRWHGIGLIHVAAAAAGLQVVLAWRGEFSVGAGFRMLIIAVGWVVVALAPDHDFGAAVLFFGAELAGRHGFYTSHRRVGL